jgi:uridine kinase
VLIPLGPGGSGEYAIRVHDMGTDTVIDTDTAIASPDAIVIFDATFIQRDTLRELWDEVIYLHSTVEAAMARGIARDAASLGGNEAARASYESRYMAACHIYLDEQKPRERASIVIDHTDPNAPTAERIK